MTAAIKNAARGTVMRIARAAARKRDTNTTTEICDAKNPSSSPTLCAGVSPEGNMTGLRKQINPHDHKSDDPITTGNKECVCNAARAPWCIKISLPEPAGKRTFPRDVCGGAMPASVAMQPPRWPRRVLFLRDVHRGAVEAATHGVVQPLWRVGHIGTDFPWMNPSTYPGYSSARYCERGFIDMSIYQALCKKIPFRRMPFAMFGATLGRKKGQGSL